MNTTPICQDDRRREAVREKRANGLDYLEVGDDRHVLTVALFGRVPEGIRLGNVRIDGGHRVRDIRALEVVPIPANGPDGDDGLRVTVSRVGDFSTYTLRLVEADTDRPLRGLDPRYTSLDFTFHAAAVSALDCRDDVACPPEEGAEPEINYLAKDYASFRQLILDRLALIMPDWTERHAPDLWLALVEILAYVGDYLSYYQDAVATEAYLATARRRISVRRHARLVDYHLHEGCNARVWISLEPSAATGTLTLDLSDTFFVTDLQDTLPSARTILAATDLPSGDFEVFEPVFDPAQPAFVAAPARSEIRFYTWGEAECCLPVGATAATLTDAFADAEKVTEKVTEEVTEKVTDKDDDGDERREAARSRRPRLLGLRPGDVLIFEEVIGPETGDADDADPARRHAVRLTQVEAAFDPLFDAPVLEVTWDAADALPFPLCLSTLGPDGVLTPNVSVARGNILLADHGRRVVDEALGVVPPSPARFRPNLAVPGLTFGVPPDLAAPAALALSQDPRAAVPRLLDLTAFPASETPWTIAPDLLRDGDTETRYVVEMDDDNAANLRFGDGVAGHLPPPGATWTASYRVGNGPAGNVPSESVAHLVTRTKRLNADGLRVRNPLPAGGGVPAEPVREAKQFAPEAFRKRLERAITPDDYAQIAGTFPGVQRASASLRWTGSGNEMQVAIDPLGSERPDAALLAAIAAFLARYRRIGHTVRVIPARSVPLTLELEVTVLPDYLRTHVQVALRRALGSRLLPSGARGFFHPDNLTFGQDIYLSRIIAAAQAVPGVVSVTASNFGRRFEPVGDALKTGILTIGPLEIARLDNEAGSPEHGVLTLEMRGGR